MTMDWRRADNFLLIWNDLSSTPTSAAILGAFGTPAEQSR